MRASSVRTGLLVRDGLGRQGIVCTRKERPSEDWINEQLNTNDFDNFVLIRYDPFHKALTNFQNSITRGLRAGQSPWVEFPTPEGFVFPLPPD
jgi:hypothetical protein